MIVTAYLITNETYSFSARDKNHAMQIAKRIIMEGLWITQPNGDEELYPVDKVFKVKISEVK